MNLADLLSYQNKITALRLWQKRFPDDRDRGDEQPEPYGQTPRPPAPPRDLWVPSA